jgi:hypothetical protein
VETENEGQPFCRLIDGETDEVGQPSTIFITTNINVLTPSRQVMGNILRNI